MRIQGQASTTIPNTTHRPLPTKTTYKPHTKPTGLNWAPSTNPQLWAKARNETICDWPHCTATPKDGLYCSRHTTAAQARQRRQQAAEQHPPCEHCGKPVHQRPSDSLKAYADRKYCSAECNRQSRLTTPTTPIGQGTRNGHTKTCKTCNTPFPTPPSSQVTNCPTCRGTKTCTKCDQPRTAHGLCSRHYQQLRKANNS